MKCSIKDCGKRTTARGWCAGHYQRWRSYGDPLGGHTEWLERSTDFWSRFDKTVAPPEHADVEGPCWVWRGSHKKSGYAQVRLGNRTARVHRVVWELTNGPIPDGLRVLHHCDNRPCGNPAHLFLGTALDNTRDMWAKGRSNLPQYNALAAAAPALLAALLLVKGVHSHQWPIAITDVVDAAIAKAREG